MEGVGKDEGVSADRDSAMGAGMGMARKEAGAQRRVRAQRRA